MLHVTNGDAAADGIRRSGIGGIVVPWRDVLHEGPVPPRLDDAALRHQRAAFLAQLAGGDAAAIERLLAQRDDILASFDLHEEVVLWFEHDLYDQLQILQILDRFVAVDRGDVVLTMVCVADHPGVPRFNGLGQLEPADFVGLFEERALVSEDEIEVAELAWQAFRNSDPTLLERLRGMDLSALPYLGDAITRHLEQFPSLRSGLSRTDRGTLEALLDGERTAAELFRTQAEREQRPFLGDLVFWWYLEVLASGPAPAVSITPPDAAEDDRWQSRVQVTEDGRRYARGEADFVAANGIDRWYGGVHLTGREARWRWDETTGHLHAGGR
jgi:hypothetical protein